jgi:serine/threonine protein phosphatase PrpC
VPVHQLDLTWGSASHRGQRTENQDRFLAEPPVFAVADGMGGHASGAEASAAVISRLKDAATGQTVEVDALRAAMQHADADIRQIGRVAHQADGAGTTVAGVALIESGGGLYWAAFHVGDSRIYRWSANRWERMSNDHSVVQELVDGGVITAEQALTHPERHMITRALGIGSGSEADYSLLPADGGQRFLICSDGLTSVLREERIAELMTGDDAASAIAEELVAHAVAAGARDNVTAVVVHVRGGGRPDAAVAEDPDSLDEITVPRPARPSGPSEAASQS